jgi:hypothetical protein
MPRQVVVSKSLVAAVANNVAHSQIPTANTPLTLNGSTVTGGVAQLDSQRRILLTYGSEAVARTLTIYGTNQAGAAISEVLAVPATAPGSVATLQDFFTVTEALDGAVNWTAAVTLGTNGVGSTPWFVPDLWLTPTLLEVACELAAGGTANWSVEITDDDPKMPLAPFQPGYSQALPICNPVGWLGLSNISANTSGVINTPIQAWRVTILSGLGVVTTKTQQAGLAQ